MISNNILAASLLHFPFVLIDVFPPNLCDYKFIMIVHVILCLNEREIQKIKNKNRKENNQEDQISELTFNFHGALSILTFFLKMSSSYSPRKAKEKIKAKEKKEKGK